MKKRVLIILLILLIEASNSFATERLLTDIEEHWAKENIVRMVVNEKINGYADGTFHPDNEVTVLEFLKITMEILNVPLIEEGRTKWPDYYLATAKQYGIEIDVSLPLSRYQACQILSRLLKIKETNMAKNHFKDLDKQYQSDVLKLTKLKIIHGYEDNTFRGEKILTRAEAVTIAIRALEINQNRINNQKYQMQSAYTNIGINEGIKSEIDQIRYEIKNQKLYFYDKGRFSHLQDYTIQEKYITNQKLIQIIQNLITEDSYTAVYYVPSDYIINQVIIQYGENEAIVNRNLHYFSVTYYEDKRYDLKRMTGKEMFSNECSCKITLKKLWRERYWREQGELVDETILQKLQQLLKIEMAKDADKILAYMLQQYEKVVTTNETIAEQVTIGKYLINTYKTDATSLEFYFEKLSS